ncbi:MAG: hypothetical protein FWF00_03825 [Endomicrobia bacterium]|nr:hypothetical protein [Endomicrobiia bacterium]MCL2506800.1 hypothetical protein [Endomicrobiia bacterium]
MYFLSLILLIIGWFYYAKPQSVQKFNDFCKNRIFNDKVILLKRKKIAVIFFFAAFVLGITAYVQSKEQSLAKEVIQDALASYKHILTEESENIAVLIKSAYAYEALGEKNMAADVWKKILTLDPENETAKQRLNVK